MVLYRDLCDFTASHQAWVVQRMDIAVHRINYYPLDIVVYFVNTYLLDSVIQPSNNWVQNGVKQIILL